MQTTTRSEIKAFLLAERQKLREIEARATPGRWEVWRGGTQTLIESRSVDGSTALSIAEAMHSSKTRLEAQRNADFIAAARNALVPLLDLIDTLEASVAVKDEALKFYARDEQVLSGADYQMYATSSYRYATDDGGELARKVLTPTAGAELLSELRRLREENQTLKKVAHEAKNFIAVVDEFPNDTSAWFLDPLCDAVASLKSGERE